MNTTSAVTESAFINKKAQYLKNKWGSSDLAFIDAFECSNNHSNSNKPLSSVYSKLAATRALSTYTNFIPVLHSLSSQTAEYKEVRHLNQAGWAHNVALRLELDHIQNLSNGLNGIGTRIKTVFDSFPQKHKNQPYIILDLKQIVDYSNPNTPLKDPGIYNNVDKFVRHILNSNIQAKIVVLATSIPDSTNIPHSLRQINREEWNEWLKLNKRYPQLAFGDYGTVGIPEQHKSGPMNIGAKFKYTTDGLYLTDRNKLLYRSTSHKKVAAGGRTIVSVMKHITSNTAFKPHHCEIEKWMSSIANGSSLDYGSPEMWIKMSTIHHMLYIFYPKQVNGVHI